MRLFHVSEEPDIKSFEPRCPIRKDMDQSKAFVWAISEECLPNFLTPRNCPRVAYHPLANSSDYDIEQFFSSNKAPYVVAIENIWVSKMFTTTLYLYEFSTEQFYLQDESAGYYVCEQTPLIIDKVQIDCPMQALFDRNIEVRILPNLWDLADKVKKTSLAWSLCRMIYAQNSKPHLR